MDWILANLALLGMIFSTARQAQIPPEVVLAIIEVESEGNPYAVRLTPTYPYTMMQAKRPGACDNNTENVMQRTSWGLMQIMGATARSIGFDGWLPELIQPNVNVRTGVAYLSNQMSRHHERHGIAGVIAAYNAGSPRTRPDGKFINQGYVDKVLKAADKYQAIVAEKEEEAVAAFYSEGASEAKENEGSNYTGGSAALDKLNKAQLLEYAKEKGITVDARAKVEDIRVAIRAAEN